MSIKRARELRQNATPPERAMWRLLKPFRDEGFHFRRQVQIGKYYADFACHKIKLIIEIDGDTHATKYGVEHDKQRDRFLKNRGFMMIRFSNKDVFNNKEGVFDIVRGFLTENPHLSPQIDNIKEN